MCFVFVVVSRVIQTCENNCKFFDRRANNNTNNHTTHTTITLLYIYKNMKVFQLTLLLSLIISILLLSEVVDTQQQLVLILDEILVLDGCALIYSSFYIEAPPGIVYTITI